METASNNAIAKSRTLPAELNTLFVLIGIICLFEIMGWIFVGQSFVFNPKRLVIIILQVSIVGIIAVGVNQVIITAGIDLSGGSLAGLAAMIATSFAQSSMHAKALYPAFTDMPVILPLSVGILVGVCAGLINGSVITLTGIPPFIATLGMLVSARGLCSWYTKGQPIYMLTDEFNAIGSGIWPVVVFFLVALIFHILLRYTI